MDAASAYVTNYVDESSFPVKVGLRLKAGVGTRLRGQGPDGTDSSTRGTSLEQASWGYAIAVDPSGNAMSPAGGISTRLEWARFDQFGDLWLRSRPMVPASITLDTLRVSTFGTGVADAAGSACSRRQSPQATFPIKVVRD